MEWDEKREERGGEICLSSKASVTFAQSTLYGAQCLHPMQWQGEVPHRQVQGWGVATRGDLRRTGLGQEGAGAGTTRAQKPTKHQHGLKVQ